ncbi:MAG: PocR ligand-binding domain-containing protein [Anaerolineales bacterium]
MSPLLTTHQVKELLKVDRITIYRMLNDGRLKGVKIGKQWRFHRSEIDQLLGKPDSASADNTAEEVLTEFPSGCVEKVEDLLAGILGIGVTTVNLRGEPLNAIVNSNSFCQLILSSETGRQACQAAWRGPEPSQADKPSFQVCPAGLCFFRSPVAVSGRNVAWVISGQFRISPSNRTQEAALISSLSENHKIPRRSLEEALHNVHSLTREQQLQVEAWTPRLAKTIQSILQERNSLTTRLKQISDLSTVRPVPATREAN